MTTDTIQHAEEILHAHTYCLWNGCSDPVRRNRYHVVLELSRKRMKRLGFTDAAVEAIERFTEMRTGEATS